jgi:branched-chain amino acid aminotransferase
MTTLVYIDGLPVSRADATISIFDHGFLFGDSVYEVMRTVAGQPFAWSPHLERLFTSAAQIGLAIPWDSEQLHAELLAISRRPELGPDAYLRIIVTRGVGELNIDPSSCRQPSRIVIARPLQSPPPEVYRDGLKLALVSTLRNSRHATNPGIKSGNYLNNVLALMEARSCGADEAVMLNEHGHVTECTTSNLFVIEGQRLATPALECGLLAGVTRALVLAQARELGIDAHEERIAPERLAAADELFITSTTRDIVPVAQVDGHPLPKPCPGLVTRRLMAAFRSDPRA